MVADHANFIDRVQKLKDARTQAMKEIDDYRRAKEQEFKAFEASVRPLLSMISSSAAVMLTVHVYITMISFVVIQHAGNTQAASAAIDKDTAVKQQEIRAAYESNKDKVVKKLLDRVILVKPELHRNLKKPE